MFLTKQGEAPPSSPLQAMVNHNLNLPQADDVQVVAEQRVVLSCSECCTDGSFYTIFVYCM